MSESIDITRVSAKFAEVDKVLILSHKNPDGDTLGSAGALCLALQSMGKTAAIECSDEIHERYDYMGLSVYHQQFKPNFIVAVDIAGIQLFGEKTSIYKDKIDLCIDHHGSNSGYAEWMLLDENAAATCEIMYDLLVTMGTTITPQIADCLYTGVSTDTGCFRFPNTTARTHRVAARLIDLGANIETLNEVLFENKSKQRIAIEQIAYSSLELHYKDSCALIALTRDQINSTGVEDSDLEGITSMPRSIEGVIVGITMRQQVSGSYKISVRTKVGYDATKVVSGLGGGGHKQAAGCEIFGGIDFAKAAILDEAAKILPPEALIVMKQPEND